MPAETLTPVINESQTTPKHSPRYRVLLHNDDSVWAQLVVHALQEVVQLSEPAAINVTITAHRTGIGLIKICDIEIAEHYRDALGAKGLTVSMEPEE